jgi:hypothetical protein
VARDGIGSNALYDSPHEKKGDGQDNKDTDSNSQPDHDGPL